MKLAEKRREKGSRLEAEKGKIRAVKRRVDVGFIFHVV